VVGPGERPEDPDYLGVEDPRITRIGGTFFMVYCGAADYPEGGQWKADTCLATSGDLLHWEKQGAVPGDVNQHSNKDGVLFPDAFNGRYWLLHRPMGGGRRLSDLHMCLASAGSPEGPWTDHGAILRTPQAPDCRESWLGAGTVPIPLGRGRYLEVYHTGNWLKNGVKVYHLDAAILDLSLLRPDHPEAVVEAKLERILVPETDWEIKAPFSDSVSNVVFTCGAYEYGPDLYVTYGGGDTYILAARIRTADLLGRLTA